MDLGVSERSSCLPKVTQLVSGTKMPSQEGLPWDKLPLVTVCIAPCVVPSHTPSGLCQSYWDKQSVLEVMLCGSRSCP